MKRAMDKRPNMTRRDAIRAFCYECFGFEMKVRECTDMACPLFEYRLGTKVEGIDSPLRPDHYRRFAVREQQAKDAQRRLSETKENAEGELLETTKRAGRQADMVEDVTGDIGPQTDERLLPGQ